MGRITFVMDDEVEKEFRELIARKYGNRKGAVGSALNEAVIMWIAKAKADLNELSGKK